MAKKKSEEVVEEVLEEVEEPVEEGVELFKGVPLDEVLDSEDEELIEEYKDKYGIA